ncbi:hypothetical protein ACJA23_01400 [Mycoplasma corogypsi]|uniref:hypothetical protein n=1 Tax=Mycoplasma corogypsi TaxID=2106 RepID=UPI00387331A4
MRSISIFLSSSAKGSVIVVISQVSIMVFWRLNLYVRDAQAFISIANGILNSAI